MESTGVCAGGRFQCEPCTRKSKENNMASGQDYAKVFSSVIFMATLLLLPSVGLTQLPLSPVLFPGVTGSPVQALKTAVIKSTTGLCEKGAICHKDKAGTWVPSTKVAIISISIAEQTDVALYVDIEVSTKPIMYLCGFNPTLGTFDPEDAIGCIFRMKYVGPGLFDYGATSGNTYLGSNITTTNLTFPHGYAIVVDAGVPIYVHLDVRNKSLLDITVDQDVWIYYISLNQ